MIMSGTEQPLSPASIAHLRKVAAEISAFFEANVAPERPSIDAAWVVLEAAIDFSDATTIEACRRVIDASLNGGPIDEADILTVDNYFK
jgi:hypothetical protein